MLAALLNLGHRERVRLVDLTQTLHHLRQVAGIQRLRRDLNHRLVIKRQRPEHVRVLLRVLSHERRRLGDAPVDALDENPGPRGSLIHGDAVPGLVHPQVTHVPHRAIFLVVGGVRLAQHPHVLTLLQRPAHNPGERVEGRAVILGVELGDHDLQRAGGVARAHGVDTAVLIRAG